MFGIIISVTVLVTMDYLILRSYKPQMVLATVGIFLMMYDVWLGFGGVLDPAKSSGYLTVGIYNETLCMLFSRIAGLEPSITAVGGYARYMERTGVSRVMVSLLNRPLKLIRPPYIVLSAIYVIDQIMAQFIASALGLGMLLMIALFPVLVSLRVSRLSAVMAIAIAMPIEWGILGTNSILTTQIAGMKIATYFLHHQLPVASCVIISVVISHFSVQHAFDKKDKNIDHGQAEQEALDSTPPLYYTILPAVPLILMFGPLFLARVGLMQSELHLAVMTSLSLTVTTFVRFFRKHNLRETIDDVQVFFNGMGTQFANAVTLVIAGGIFAKGLATIDTVDVAIRGVEYLDLDGIGVMIIMALVTTICAIVMGSGNVPFVSLVSLIPNIVTGPHVPAIVMTMPMHLTTTLVRAVSSITAVVIVTSGTTGVSPLAVVERIAIPMVVGLIVNMIVTIALFYQAIKRQNRPPGPVFVLLHNA